MRIHFLLNRVLTNWLAAWALLCLCFLLSTGSSAAQDEEIPASLYPNIETSVDQNQLTIGDVFHLRIQLTYDPRVSIITPPTGAEVGQFEVQDVNPGLTETLENGRKQRVITYTLSIYETGEFEIPSISIEFQTESGQTGVVHTAPITVTVQSLLPAESENLDIKNLKPQRTLAGWNYLWVLLGALAGIAVLALLGYRLWKRWQQKRAAAEPVIVLTPHEQALQDLAELRKHIDDYIVNKAFKDFSFRVSEILRVYIQHRWKIPAMDETSNEIIASLQDLYAAEALLEQFRSFFESCDLIKFAKHEPQKNEMINLIDQAESIVQNSAFPSEPEEPSQTARSEPQEAPLPADAETQEAARDTAQDTTPDETMEVRS